MYKIVGCEVQKMFINPSSGIFAPATTSVWELTLKKNYIDAIFFTPVYALHYKDILTDSATNFQRINLMAEWDYVKYIDFITLLKYD